MGDYYYMDDTEDHKTEKEDELNQQKQVENNEPFVTNQIIDRE